MLDAMPDASITVHAWGPKIALLVLAAAGGVALAALAVLSGDPAGRLLLGLAAAGLLLSAAVGTLGRPRLTADSHGITVRGVTGRRRVAWSQLTQWEVAAHHRLGRKVPVLELTVLQHDHEALLLFSTLDLGADPVDVLDVLRQLRRS